ncbi:unnamed protein product [Cuscuta epithymum]|uniref:Uncharacterized protein n=1 Tax=Cuscuta epithymum TaxID=186058 RepID=A0AAV0F1G5_9ASTE|nr:unnamed protein product [Cuscuta epithymum]
MEYMAQEPPAHRLLLLLHKFVEPREQLRPNCDGPSLKIAQNTYWGAFGLPGRKLQTSQDGLSGIRSCWEEVTENGSLRHCGALGTRGSLRLNQAFGHKRLSAAQGSLVTWSPRPHQEPSAKHAQIVEDSFWRQPTTAFNATSHPPTAFNAVNVPLPVPPG